MKTRIGLALFALGILLYVFTAEQAPIAKLQDIDDSLQVAPKNPDWLQKDIAFWQSKLDQVPGEFSYKAKLAGAYGLSFSKSRVFADLFKAGTLWAEVNEQTHFKEAGFLRAAARNAISRHEFEQAASLLLQAEKLGEGLRATQLMRFDVAMELAQYDVAENLLKQTEDFSDVDFLIRYSKWNDYKGNLDEAIFRLEQVLAWAKERNNTSLEFWAVSNLGDYYGHAGTIEKAYAAYLKALALDPSSTYAKKGIAYIAFANDKDPQKALSIIDGIANADQNPDLLLLKADIFEYTGALQQRTEVLNQFKEVVQEQGLETLYRMPLTQIAIDERDFDLALQLARMEVSHRATPQTYDLLAWTYFSAGDIESALKITEAQVLGQSEEPVLLLHSAEILKAAGKLSAVNELKEELEEASFELGPIATKQVMAL
ncbi:tetratricopeptide repeat protein [Gilvibacter sp.]|uniref:tetratricopeptide repeat protein n=1 Tax=Gilvibacter sp. TaxID=2729997 RepID=UPI003F49BD08